MHFEYRRIDGWAPLAWIAVCRNNDPAVEVWHGPHVETHPQWFCEAVWPAPFADGDFDCTDLLAGTGGRLRDSSAIFVAPGNTVDRIVSLRTSDGLFVSNSLPCLLSVSHANVDPCYARYYEDFCTIVRGLKAYKRNVRTTAGDIHLTVYGSVRWDGVDWTASTREVVRRDFSSFERYVGFLETSLAALAANMADAKRARKLRFLATTSSGYDSSAVSALARRAGCEQTLCIETDRNGAQDDGVQLAHQLGLQPLVVGRADWCARDCPEVLFMASDGTAEAVPLTGAEEALRDRVLLTGYHGDKVWAKDAKDLSEDIVRGDSSGLSLSEYRLWVGFIHCPITFWGVRQIAELNRLSNSPQMRPWDIAGDYSRPIPRRIVESAGGSRAAFGVAKRASAISFSEAFSETALCRYREWLSENRLKWIVAGKLPPIQNARYERVARGAFAAFEGILHRMPLFWRLAPDNSLDRPSALRRYCFPWAVGEVAARYARALD